MKADVARFYCANKEQIFETGSFKNIDTVRNMVAGVWSVLLLQSVQEVHGTTKKEKCSVNVHCRVWAQYSGCMYAKHE